MKTSNNN